MDAAIKKDMQEIRRCLAEPDSKRPAVDDAPDQPLVKRPKRSTNPFSVRRRAYVASLDGKRYEALKAVNNDRNFRLYQEKKFKGQHEYKNAPDNEKPTLLKQYVDKMWEKRAWQGKTAEQIKEKLGLWRPVVAVPEDNDPHREDITDLPEYGQEELWHQDEEAEGLDQTIEATDDLDDQVCEVAGLRMDLVTFRAWQRHWRIRIRRVKKKFRSD
ncbi:MAG: hypothetical protein M1816_005652 [Peltula sp. TS41687]|nr:MAG: hypothetical protein M1816_005652 [Peltula sp. TS41687]